MLAFMRHLILSIAVVMVASAAQAACYADYKAKRDNPLTLHYGVAEIRGACDPDNAQAQLQPKLAADGWTLLQVVSVFGQDGLDQRKANAGQFFLRY